jgi:hypothetical protein
MLFKIGSSCQTARLVLASASVLALRRWLLAGHHRKGTPAAEARESDQRTRPH